MWREDLTGRVFGRLTVVEFFQGSEPGRRRWICRCSCGNDHVVLAGKLKSGEVSSCGCFRREVQSRPKPHLITHGASKTPLYSLHHSLLLRCRCPTASNYKYYGARGIKVCERWQGPSGFLNFLSDMGPRPSAMHSVERKDTDGHYTPENCHWATSEEQAQNKRNTIRVVFGGEEMSLRKASRLAGIKYSTVLERRKRGWTTERALLP
jgi:hypothetical protein